MHLGSHNLRIISSNKTGNQIMLLSGSKDRERRGWGMTMQTQTIYIVVLNMLVVIGNIS